MKYLALATLALTLIGCSTLTDRKTASRNPASSGGGHMHIEWGKVDFRPVFVASTISESEKLACSKSMAKALDIIRGANNPFYGVSNTMLSRMVTLRTSLLSRQKSEFAKFANFELDTTNSKATMQFFARYLARFQESEELSKVLRNRKMREYIKLFTPVSIELRAHQARRAIEEPTAAQGKYKALQDLFIDEKKLLESPGVEVGMIKTYETLVLSNRVTQNLSSLEGVDRIFNALWRRDVLDNEAIEVFEAGQTFIQRTHTPQDLHHIQQLRVMFDWLSGQTDLTEIGGNNIPYTRLRQELDNIVGDAEIFRFISQSDANELRRAIQNEVRRSDDGGKSIQEALNEMQRYYADYEEMVEAALNGNYVQLRMDLTASRRSQTLAVGRASTVGGVALYGAAIFGTGALAIHLMQDQDSQ